MFSSGTITTQGFDGFNITIGSGGNFTTESGLVNGANGLVALNYTYISDFNVLNGGTLTTAGNAEVVNTNLAGTVVSGKGSEWLDTGDLRVLSGNAYPLTISASGALSVDGVIDLGDTTYDNNLGPNSIGSTTGDQNGALAISSGGKATSATGILGNLVGTTGTVTIDGAGSSWAVAGGATDTGNTTVLFIGNNGTGTVNISNGGVLSSGSLAAIGYAPGSNGSVTVNGQGSAWNAYGITVGASGNGSLIVSNQGMVNAAGGFQIGAYGAPGGDNILQVQSGGDVVSGNSFFIGIGGDNGSATITGQGSTLSINAGSLRVGSSGTGSLNVFSGASLTTAIGVTTVVGGASNAGVHGNGTLFISGTGSATLNGPLVVGDAGGTGLVRVETGGKLTVNYGSVTLGSAQYGSGTLRLYGATLAAPNIPFHIGVAGTGELDIQSGSALNLGSQTLVLGEQATGTGTVNVVTGGSLTVGGLTLGGAGTGVLDIGGADAFGATGPGTVNVTGQLNIGVAANSTGTLTINGASTLKIGGISAVGDAGSGTIDLESGAKITLGAVTLGNQANSNGTLIVGAGSSFTGTGLLTVGNAGNGTVMINGGAVSLNNGLMVGNKPAGGTGAVTISNGGTLKGPADGVDTLYGAVNVTGQGSAYTAASILNVKTGGALNILAGGNVSGQIVNIGDGSGMGSVKVDGAGSLLSDGQSLSVINGSTLTVSGGAKLDGGTSIFTTVGDFGAASTLLVTGQGSVADLGNGSFTAGSATNGSFGYVQVLGGGVLDTGETILSGGVYATGNVSGAASTWMANDLTIQNSADFLVDQGGSLFVAGNATVQAKSMLRADDGTIKISGSLSLGTDDSRSASDLSLQNSSTLEVTGGLSAGDPAGQTNSLTIASSKASAASVNLANTEVDLSAGSSLTTQSATLLKSTLTADATSNVAGLSTLLVEQGSTVDLSAGSSMTVSKEVGLSGGTIRLGSGGFLAIGSGGKISTNQTQLIVFKDGLLSGVGTIYGSALNGGVLHVGDDPGTITIQGNYQQSATGTLEIEVGPVSASLLDVTGAADLEGGSLDLMSVDGGMINLGQRYTVLTAGAGITGAFAKLTTSSPFIALTPVLSDGTLAFTAEHMANSFAAIAQTPNQAAVARVLDRAASTTVSGDFYDGLNDISNGSVAAVRQSFATLSGEAYGDFATVAIDQARGFDTILLDRIDGVANGEGDDMHLVLSGDSDAPQFQTAMTTNGGGPDADAADRRYYVWAQALGGFDSASGAGGSHGFNSSNTGMAAGLDTNVSPNWIAGVAFSYNHDWLSSNGVASSGTMDNYNFALYSGLTMNRFFLSGTLGYDNGSGTLSRDLDLASSGRAATGKPAADQVFATLETGYQFAPIGTLTAASFARLDAAHYWQNGFTETGAGDFDLSVASRHNNSVQTTLGAKLADELNVLPQALPLTATLSAGWGHEFADTQRPVTAAFAGAPGMPFTVDATAVDRDTAVLGAGLAMNAGPAEIFARYDGQYGARTDTSGFTGGISLAW